MEVPLEQGHCGTLKDRIAGKGHGWGAGMAGFWMPARAVVGVAAGNGLAGVAGPGHVVGEPQYTWVTVMRTVIHDSR